MPMLKLTAAVIVALSVSAAAQAVTPLTYGFLGRVTRQGYGTACPAFKAVVPITITIDSSFPPTSTSDTLYEFSEDVPGNSKPPILAVSINNEAPFQPGNGDLAISRGFDGYYYAFAGTRDGAPFGFLFAASDPAVIPDFSFPPAIRPTQFTRSDFQASSANRHHLCEIRIISRLPPAK